MDCGSVLLSQFLLNLNGAVRNLTFVKERIARDMLWEAKREEREKTEAAENKLRAERVAMFIEKKFKEQEAIKSAQEAMRNNLRIGDRFSFQPIKSGKLGGLIEDCEVISKSSQSFLVKIPHCEGYRRCYKTNMVVTAVFCRDGCECTECARNRPCECGCGLKGGTCEEQTKKNEGEQFLCHNCGHLFEDEDDWSGRCDDHSCAFCVCACDECKDK